MLIVNLTVTAERNLRIFVYDYRGANIAFVPQKPWLLNATLKENILFGQAFNFRR